MQRDTERIQAFHQKVILRKELPFANISNSAFTQCMDLTNTLRIQLASVTSKLKSFKEICAKEQALNTHVSAVSAENVKLKEEVRDLQLQIRITEESHTEKEQHFKTKLDNLDAENSKLRETIRDFQDQLSVSVVQKDTVSTLRNKIHDLEKQLDMERMCGEALIKQSNRNYLELAENKNELQQKLAVEKSEKEIYRLLLKKEQQSLRDLQTEMNELKQCNLQLCPSVQHQCFQVQQFDPYQEQVYPYEQPNAPPQCEPMPYQNFRPYRGRRSRRGTFF